MRRFFPLLLLLASVGLFFAYVNPTYNGLADLKQQTAKLDEALNKAKELQSIRDQLLSKYNTFSSGDLERLKKLLPDHIDNVRLIIDIDDIASRYGMSVTKVAISKSESGAQKNNAQAGTAVAEALPGVPTGRASAASTGQGGFSLPPRESRGAVSGSAQEDLGTVDLSFSVSTSYETFLAFLRDLERSLRLVDVTKLSFNAASSNQYDFTITIRTYWLR